MRIFILTICFFGSLLALPVMMSANHHDETLNAPLLKIGPTNTTPIIPVAAESAQNQADEATEQPAEDARVQEGKKDEESPAVNPSGIQGKRERKKIQIDLSDLVIRPV